MYDSPMEPDNVDEAVATPDEQAPAEEPKAAPDALEDAEVAVEPTEPVATAPDPVETPAKPRTKVRRAASEPGPSGIVKRIACTTCTPATPQRGLTAADPIRAGEGGEPFLARVMARALGAAEPGSVVWVVGAEAEALADVRVPPALIRI